MAEGGSGTPPRFRLVTSTDPFRAKLHRMQQQGMHTDFLIKAGSVNIPCHKVIIAARFDFFDRMLQHKDTTEVSQGVVQLEDLDSAAVQLVLDYGYTGEIDFDFDDAKDVIEVVDRLQVSDDVIMEKLSAYVISHLSAENCLGWFVFADRFQLSDVKEKANDTMLNLFRDVVKASEFLELSFLQVSDYLSHQMQEQSADRDQALVAAARWTMHDVDTRKENFEQLVNIIDLTKCTPKVIKSIYDKHRKSLITTFELLERFTTAALSLVASDEPSECESGQNILVIGGRTASNEYNRKTWQLDLMSGESVEKSPLPGDRFAAAICSHPDGAVCAGGATKDDIATATTDCLLYQTDQDTWIPLSSLQAPTIGAGAVTVDSSKLMVIGGFGDGKKKAVCLDLERSTWISCPDMLQGVVFPIVGCVKKSVFVVFSTNGANVDARRGSKISLQVYHENTSTWSFKAPLPDSVTDTAGACAVTIDELMYVIGGQDKICLSYNPNQDSWTVLAPTLEPHLFGAALVLNNKIIVCGSRKDDYTGTDVIEEYDPSTNIWRLLPVKLPVPQWEHGVIVV